MRSAAGGGRKPSAAAGTESREVTDSKGALDMPRLIGAREAGLG